ncbi:MAG: hypothetical protein HOK72_01060 [Flavobacteriales bacterium]|nr:hypothetical protein [Flavobacteriales bacterium]
MKSSKVAKLVIKYNDVLKESMRNVVAEDLVNLIIVNGDDKEFELKDMISKKAKFKEMVFREFMRLNSNVVTKELSEMEEVKLSINKGKQRRLKI